MNSSDRSIWTDVKYAAAVVAGMLLTPFYAAREWLKQKLLGRGS